MLDWVGVLDDRPPLVRSETCSLEGGTKPVLRNKRHHFLEEQRSYRKMIVALDEVRFGNIEAGEERKKRVSETYQKKTSTSSQDINLLGWDQA